MMKKSSENDLKMSKDNSNADHSTIRPDNGPSPLKHSDAPFQSVDAGRHLEQSEINEDVEDLDEDVMCPPEPTPCVRTTYRMLMGLIPAVMASFLTKSIISVISTASGF